MHIPDGMLSTTVATVTDASAIGFVAYGTYWVKKYFDQKKIVLMAVLGALIFALQMLNFPVAGGTSGHFAGGALAAIVLGPWPALIVLTAVLLVQALLFSDGGVIALGANITNMAVIAPFVGYLVFALINKFTKSRAGRVVGSAISAWAACLVAACAAGLEIWASGHAAFNLIMPAMAGWHAIIGIGEALITGGVLTYLLAVRPDLVEAAKSREVATTGRAPIRSVSLTLGVVACIAAGLSWLASAHPDGLEFVYFESGIGKAFKEVSLLGDGTIFAGYGVRGLSSDALATVLAGLVGLVVVGLALWVLFAQHKNRVKE